MATDPVKVHPLPVRITHWVNALAILVLNGMIYLAYGIASGHLRRKMLPLSPAR